MPPVPDRIRGTALAPEDRGRMVRAAALRPLNLVVLVVGVVFFLLTTIWWVLPLTLATYAALIYLGTRDPILQNRVLGREIPGVPRGQDLPPERRARWLPRGETRQEVDATLVEYRKVIAAIEASDDVTLAVLRDTVPRLHAAADRLVDIALAREKAAESVRELRGASGDQTGARSGDLRQLEEHIAQADAEISASHEELLDLRAKVVRVSIDADNAQRVRDLNASLDELNARLEALGELSSARE